MFRVIGDRGLSRRSFVQAGLLGVGGLTLPDFFRFRAHARSSAPDASVILLWMSGGPGHMETWDPKPNAVAQFRGPFGATRTRVPGVLQEDPEQFDQRYEAGRQFFHGPDGDKEELDWLDGLLEAVSACVEVTSAMGPLGYRYREEDGFWEIWIYPTPVELVGGAHDGAVVAPDFSLDLEELRSFFDSIEALGWHALGLNWSEGPHVYVEGVYEGHEVYLKVLAQAPEGEEPGMKVNTASPRPRQN